MSKNIKIGLFGFGCVGQGLFRVLSQAQHIKAEIVKIVVKDINKERSLPAHFFTDQATAILNDNSIDVVVELINDSEAAYHIVTTALRNGKNVVTANKKMVATHLEELVKLQKQYGGSLLYEASSCGSIPIIRTLEEYYDNELLLEVKGIFNGSSNYILSKIFNEDQNYSSALKQAQDLGFAETDPTLDVGGYDARSKLSIIAAHAFGVFIKPDNIFCYGIENLSNRDVAFAKANGYKIKLIAKAFKQPSGRLALSVMPHFISEGHKLYNIENEYNAVLVSGAFSEQQVFIGKGAGGNPTGAAVLSDISALTYNYKYAYKKKQHNNRQQPGATLIQEVYIRTDTALPFGGDAGWTSFTINGNKFIRGKITLGELASIKSLLIKHKGFIACFDTELYTDDAYQLVEKNAIVL